jgi:hypothetical protein
MSENNRMDQASQTRRWRLGHAAFWGMASAVAIDLVQDNSSLRHIVQWASVDPFSAVGTLIGTLLGGAVLFVLIVAIRNRIVTGSI